MAIHKVTLAVVGSGMELTEDINYTNTGVVMLDGKTVANGQTNLEFAFTLDFSKCKAFYLVSDKDVTFETNDGAAPDLAISLRANEPYLWHETAYHTFLVADDITSVFFTNASGSTATIYCIALFDPTM